LKVRLFRAGAVGAAALAVLTTVCGWAEAGAGGRQRHGVVRTPTVVPAALLSLYTLENDSVAAALTAVGAEARSFPSHSARPRDRWLARDKAAHFAASAFLSAFGYYVARREQEWRNRPSQQFGLVFGFSFGIAKEVRDARCPQGTASWKDLVVDAVGCLVGTALVAVPDGVVFGGEP